MGTANENTLALTNTTLKICRWRLVGIRWRQMMMNGELKGLTLETLSNDVVIGIWESLAITTCYSMRNSLT